MWGVGGAEGEVEKDGTIRPDSYGVGIHRKRPIDEIFRQVVALVGSSRWLHHVIVRDEVGVELVGLTVEESVEAVEAAAERPLVEWAGC